jgi:hypothetical protein
MWEFEYRNRAEKAQKEGKVEEAEMYEVMADTVVLFKGCGVFEGGEDPEGFIEKQLKALESLDSSDAKRAFKEILDSKFARDMGDSSVFGV